MLMAVLNICSKEELAENGEVGTFHADTTKSHILSFIPIAIHYSDDVTINV
jgi:hypothetical protein